jgi:hypothetical protein
MQACVDDLLLQDLVEFYQILLKQTILCVLKKILVQLFAGC